MQAPRSRLTAALSLGLALSFPGLAAEPAKSAPPPPKTVAVRAARLLDVRAGKYVDHPVVVIRGDRIESVGTSAAPAGMPVVDLGERTLLPGFIDAHTHVLLQGDATAP